MRIRAGAAFVFVVSFVIAAGLGTVRADLDARSQAAVATVGSAEISVGALEQRIASIPDFQLATFGSTPAEQKRRFLEQVMVRDAVLSEGARTRQLDQNPEVKERADAALRTARIEALRAELAVTPEEITAFFIQNQSRFESPERVAVFRILCRTREDAASVLAEAKQSGTVMRWNELARERSIDKATSLRGGNLGFLAADGSSNEPSVKVDAALFAAASRVKDGEFVPEPVKEGEGYAAVWRRGTVPAMHRTMAEQTTAIRQILTRKKLEEGTRALLARLRSEQKVEEQPQLIELVEVDSNGTVLQRKRPGVVPRKPSMPPAPSATPRGLR